MIPKAAAALVPVLWLEAAAILPEVPRHYFAGQVEQESCISLTHSKCWNPRAELKTEREYGFGLGQVTKVWRADGSVRFDNFEEARRKYRELKDWSWERRFDARLQLRAMLLMDRDCYRAAPFASDGLNRAAMLFVCYNSGKGGLLQDRQLCRNVEGCDPSRWFGHIENHSLKARTKVAGYGKSFFEISREYPKSVIYVRSPKYKGVA